MSVETVQHLGLETNSDVDVIDNMATELEGIKEVTEALLGIGDVAIDNFTFKLFYKWSVSFYIASSVTVVSSQFFGDQIHCDIVSERFRDY